ncbi:MULTISPECIES: S24 family peptidase [Methylosinus]|uniref:HTH cro/C1-type domain-containing protein n=1 Tax=Methylosinus trichosporium (strain ATCC 35070 / NCIMB 11131 / UNIQEM 75 / OB3b) TaxID=595536 RepID=A0A2D2CYN7_METT3|nr:MULTISPECIES: LexA family transcriptional regulator [Methylosinus]ATQ67759.1 hypothetical protein CQW49_07525 [Methylosinus trichosporium OB3b]OBS51134.1 hypothetical protein A8B73_17580 [Methylosinus sp. 3S-1]
MIDEPNERLRQARIAAGYPSATAAAEAMGANKTTYISHENGHAGLSRAGKRYAAFFRVSLDWLLTGKSPMKGDAMAIPVTGYVLAGRVELDAADQNNIPDAVYLPLERRLAALIIRGDSQYPRFCDGEFILYDPEPLTPRQLIGQLAIVQALDGRCMLKIIDEGPQIDTWTLKSHNAPDEKGVKLLSAWRYLGALPPV